MAAARYPARVRLPNAAAARRAARVVAALAVALAASGAGAQHGHDAPEPDDDDLPPVPEAPPLPPPEWPRPPTPPTDALRRDEAREASGTAWQPLATPHRAYHLALGPAALTFHGDVFLAWTDQGGPRGGREAFAASWLMAMGRVPVGPGSLTLRAMASLDPFTMPVDGYRELLQTGESAGGEPLHDRQHPHDLWMELAAIARAPLGDAAALELYAARVGEPALGPVAFPHRASALHDPMAPLSHHWMDSTHVSSGVLTGALALRDVKLEGSWFTGREPDEHRTDLDPVHLDSWSGRASVAPTPELVLQVSYGWLRSPEALFPGEDVHRLTASATWNDRLGRSGDAGLLVAWGRNVSAGRAEDAVLLEGTWEHDGRNAIFGRFEWVVKSARDLALPGVAPEETFDVFALGAGVSHAFGPVLGALVAVGARVELHQLPAALQPSYGGSRGLGGSSPLGVVLFLQLLPALHDLAPGGERGPAGGHAGHAERAP